MTASCRLTADRKANACASARTRPGETSVRARFPSSMRTLAERRPSSSPLRRCSRHNPPSDRVRAPIASIARSSSIAVCLRRSLPHQRRGHGRNARQFHGILRGAAIHHEERGYQRNVQAFAQLAARKRDHAQTACKPDLARMRKRNDARRPRLRHSGCDHALTAKYSIAERFFCNERRGRDRPNRFGVDRIVARDVVIEQMRRTTYDRRTHDRLRDLIVRRKPAHGPRIQLHFGFIELRCIGEHATVISAICSSISDSMRASSTPVAAIARIANTPGSSFQSAPAHTLVATWCSYTSER